MRMSDASASVGGPLLRVAVGYLYTTDNPYYYYDQAPPPPAGSAYYVGRNEITLSANSRWGDYRFERVCPPGPGPQLDGVGRRRCDL